jgi:ribosomal-protein-alanine N-acetyltransferase
MAIPPELATPRLLLRAFATDDLDALSAIYADPDVMATIRGGVRSRAATEAALAAYADEWEAHDYGVWAVIERESGALLGMCGFVAHAELGYIFARAAWGQGIATEAAAACLTYGFTLPDFDEIFAGALAENAGSRRVLEKLGMRRWPNDYFDRNGGVYYRIERRDWLAAGARG